MCTVPPAGRQLKSLTATTTRRILKTFPIMGGRSSHSILAPHGVDLACPPHVCFPGDSCPVTRARTRYRSGDIFLIGISLCLCSFYQASCMRACVRCHFVLHFGRNLWVHSLFTWHRRAGSSSTGGATVAKWRVKYNSDTRPDGT